MKKVTNKTKLFAIVLAMVACGLLIAGFFVPPMGVVDGSVLKAAGEVIGMISIFFAWDSVESAIEKGMGTKFQHGNTSVTVGKKTEDEE